MTPVETGGTFRIFVPPERTGTRGTESPQTKAGCGFPQFAFQERVPAPLEGLERNAEPGTGLPRRTTGRKKMIECAFTGRLGRDAELRHVKNGTLPMLAFSAAVEGGQAADDAPAQWVRVVVFGETAEQMAPRLLKGVKVYVEGRLTAELWQPDDGRAPRVNMNVTASTVQPIGHIGRCRPRQARSQSTWSPVASRRRRSTRGAIAMPTFKSASTGARPTRCDFERAGHHHNLCRMR
jgi:single stranded DNA-binding protein